MSNLPSEREARIPSSRSGAEQYASAATIRRGIAAIEKQGSVVSRVIYRPDGSLEYVIGANDDELSEFDRLDATGRL